MTFRTWVLALALGAASLHAQAQAQAAPPPAAVVADPAPDAAHPARLSQVRYPTGGVQVPARMFVAAGAGAHPTVLLLHGFPGTELNLDLARAMQRAGWNVLAIHYRGVWGAPGEFRFAHTVEDARAALAWLRDPANAAKYGIDASRLVVLGHSMGGFDTVMVGDDAQVAGFVLISAADIGGFTAWLETSEGQAKGPAEFAEDLSFTNMSYEEMVSELRAEQAAFDWRANAAEMKGRPVLIVDSDDGALPTSDLAAQAVAAAGGPVPTRVKFATDHSFNDHRIALAAAVVGWLQATFPAAK